MLLALVLAQAIALGNPEGPIFSQPSLMNRLAQFEAYNLVSTDWCSTAAGTGNGARGEPLTFTRASAATCTKGVNGLRATDIADGDVVGLSANQIRMMADEDGYLGPLVEAAGTTINIQARPICNAAYSDVGTPDCAADATTGPWGTTTMGAINDNDAAAKEGRSQTVATTSATRFTAYCYVKGDDLKSATLILAGTGSAAGDCTATIDGLSATTNSIVECTSPVAYAGTLTAVTVSILAGSTVGDTGRIYVEGCDVKASALYRTSINDTGAVAVTRAADDASFSTSISTATGLSWAASTTHTSSSGGSVWASGVGLVANATNRTQIYRSNSNVTQCSYFSTAGSSTAGVAQAFVAGQTYRHGCYLDQAPGANTVLRACLDGTCTPAASFTASAFTITTIIPGALGTATTTGPADGIVTRVCVDPSPTRCR